MYEDYLKNLLGGYPYQNTYATTNRNTEFYPQFDGCSQCNFPQNMFGYDTNYISNMYESYDYSRNALNPEDLYPEIYKIIYPMIQKACAKITRPIDDDLIEEMTKDIYSNIEAGNIVNLNINIDNDNTVSKTQTSTTNHRNAEKTIENRATEDRQHRNPLLSDLIRILLLREFFGRPYNRPSMLPRPPFPGAVPRPPMPPRPRF